jgi:hypothetical protein
VVPKDEKNVSVNHGTPRGTGSHPSECLSSLAGMAWKEMALYESHVARVAAGEFRIVFGVYNATPPSVCQ